jgi:hypothetical protein
MNKFNWALRLMSFLTFAVADGGGGAVVDRGDDWTPTDDDPPPAKDAPKDPPKADDTPPKDAPKGDETADKTAEELEAEAEAAAAAEAEAAAAAKEGKGKGKGKDDRIPASRHKEILDRERNAREAVERELAALKQAQQVTKTNEDITAAETKIVGLEAEYLKLLEKGDVPGAAAKMAEIRRTEREVIQGRATFEIQAAEARAFERVKYDTTVERLEAAFPVLNPDHEDHDPAKAAEVVELRDAYVATGKYTRAEAVQKACKTLLGPATTRQTAAVTADVRVDKEEVAKAAAAERKAAAVARALETSTKQPANAAGVGANSDAAGATPKAAEVIKMSQAEFAKLDEATLKKLRGDEV